MSAAEHVAVCFMVILASILVGGPSGIWLEYRGQIKSWLRRRSIVRRALWSLAVLQARRRGVAYIHSDGRGGYWAATRNSVKRGFLLLSADWGDAPVVGIAMEDAEPGKPVAFQMGAEGEIIRGEPRRAPELRLHNQIIGGLAREQGMTASVSAGEGGGELGSSAPPPEPVVPAIAGKKEEEEVLAGLLTDMESEERKAAQNLGWATYSTNVALTYTEGPRPAGR